MEARRTEAEHLANVRRLREFVESLPEGDLRTMKLAALDVIS